MNMRIVAPVVASVITALLMLQGFLHLDSSRLGLSASEGAALALAVITAFLLTYDLFGRARKSDDGKDETRRRTRSVAPNVDPHALFVLEAANRARAKDGHAYVNGRTQSLDHDTPVALSIPVRDGADLDRDHLLEQLRTVSANFKSYPYVHFFTGPRKHLCFADTGALIKLLEQLEPGRGFVGLLNTGRDDELVKAYEKDGLRSLVIDNTLDENAALKALALARAEAAMVVFAANQRALGVIDWPTLALRIAGEVPRLARRPSPGRREPV